MTHMNEDGPEACSRNALEICELLPPQLWLWHAAEEEFLGLDPHAFLCIAGSGFGSLSAAGHVATGVELAPLSRYSEHVAVTLSNTSRRKPDCLETPKCCT